MSGELDTVRIQFGRFLTIFIWLHVPVLAVAAALTDHSVVLTVLAGAAIAGAYHLTWHLRGTRPVTRYVSSIALIGQPAVLLLLLQGYSWQMDMHMYFFAMLALTIAWLDRKALIIAAVATALHHLLLLYLMPYAVFPGQSNIARVLLHAGIVALQTAVLVWLSEMVVASFTRIGRMSEEIGAKNAELEERTREAEEATRAKSLFLANMSHEIRTPMNAVIGFCHLVQRTDLSAKQQDYVGKISGAINDILDFSKNEDGKLKLESKAFDPANVIQGQINLLAEEAATKRVGIATRIDRRYLAACLGTNFGSAR